MFFLELRQPVVLLLAIIALLNLPFIPCIYYTVLSCVEIADFERVVIHGAKVDVFHKISKSMG